MICILNIGTIKFLHMIKSCVKTKIKRSNTYFFIKLYAQITAMVKLAVRITILRSLGVIFDNKIAKPVETAVSIDVCFFGGRFYFSSSGLPLIKFAI